MDLTELQSLRSKVLIYKHILDRVDELRDKLEWMTARYGPEPRGGGGGDKMSGMVAQMEDLKDSTCKQLIEIEKKRYEAEQAIAILPAQQATVMYLRYIEGMSWAQVAQETHYSIKHLSWIHHRAKKNFERDT